MSPMRVFGTTKRRFGNLSDFKCISSNINLFMLWEPWVAEINPICMKPQTYTPF